MFPNDTVKQPKGAGASLIKNLCHGRKCPQSNCFTLHPVAAKCLASQAEAHRSKGGCISAVLCVSRLSCFGIARLPKWFINYCNYYYYYYTENVKDAKSFNLISSDS